MPGIAPAALGISAACAAGPHAALVIDTGTRELDLCVELPGASVSGIDLVRLGAEQHGVDYSLGFGGQAVCRLAGVGPDGGDCFAEYPDFWGLWVQQGGAWVWSSTGAGSVRISNGGIEGWSWGSGDGPATHPKPSPVTTADVCGVAEPPPRPSATAAPHPSASATPVTGGGGTPGPSVPATGGASASPHRSRTPTPAGAPTASPPSTSASEPRGIEAAAARRPGNGPPGAGIAAVGLAAVLLAGGSFALRRRGRRAH